MGISATYIAVIILLCVLIGFVLSVIFTLANTASNKIRLDMNRVLDSYNHLLNEKMNQYNQQNIELKKMNNLVDKEVSSTNVKENINNNIKKDQKISSSSFVRKEASRRIISLVDGYGSIKNEFREYAKDVDINDLQAIANKSKLTEFEQAVLNLNEMLNAESIYELSLLPNNEQLAFFKQILSTNDRIVLDKFLEITNRDFNSIEFFDWIKTNARSSSKTVIVRSGDINTDGQYDPSICEGCQVVTGNKIFDFSISKRDIQ